MTDVKRVVTRVAEGTYTEIQSRAKEHAQTLATVFDADTVDVDYGTFRFVSERYFTRDGEKVPDVVFKVTVKYIATIEV